MAEVKSGQFRTEYLSVKIGIITTALSIALGEVWTFKPPLDRVDIIHISILLIASFAMWYFVWMSMFKSISGYRVLFSLHVVATALVPFAVSGISGIK